MSTIEILVADERRRSGVVEQWNLCGTKKDHDQGVELHRPIERKRPDVLEKGHSLVYINVKRPKRDRRVMGYFN